MSKKINGVRWDDNRKRWTARITAHNKRIFLGQFTNEESAIHVRQEAEQTLNQMTQATKEEAWSKMKDIKEKHSTKSKTNIIGDKIGRLTIINKAQTRKETYQRNGVQNQRNIKYYICKCDCGNTIEVRESKLIYKNKQQSCGCLVSENSRDLGIKSKKDISGNKYGKLTTIKSLNKNKQGEYMWLCQCECGNQTKVRIGHLTDGTIQSCGCIQKKMMINRGKTVGPINIKKVSQFSVEHTNLMRIDPNKKIPTNNTSGTIGVTMNKSNKKWRAVIGFQGKKYHLGEYHDKNIAINARKEAESLLYEPMLNNHLDLTTEMKKLKQKNTKK